MGDLTDYERAILRRLAEGPATKLDLSPLRYPETLASYKPGDLTRALRRLSRETRSRRTGFIRRHPRIRYSRTRRAWEITAAGRAALEG